MYLYYNYLHFRDGKIPVNKAGLFSYMFMIWMTPLVMKMFKQRDEELKEDDIWQCSDWEACKINTDRLIKSLMQCIISPFLI
jgi:hypothetical protein